MFGGELWRCGPALINFFKEKSTHSLLIDALVEFVPKRASAPPEGGGVYCLDKSNFLVEFVSKRTSTPLEGDGIYCLDKSIFVKEKAKGGI